MNPPGLVKFRNLSDINLFGDILEDLIKEEKEKKILDYKVNYDEYCKFSYMKEPGGIGLELIDKESIELGNKVVNFVVSSLGKNFLSGRDFTHVSLPIFINDQRTMLEL